LISPKSKVVAGFLGLIFGWLGLHRLYLGYTGQGILMFILSLLCLIPMIVFSSHAYTPSPTTSGITSLCLSGSCTVLALPVLGGMEIWGLIEGIMILAGGIDVDAQGRRL
jgi:uncharacterized membrane protein